MKKKDLVVIFDDTCNLCNASVRFIIRHDRKKRFRFTGLNSRYGLDLAGRNNMHEFSSVVLEENKHLYFRSTAALRIFRYLDLPWPVFYVFIIVPRPVRDAVYHFISEKREKWFGRSAECRVCKTEGPERFISE